MATDYAILPELDEQEQGFAPALDALRGLLASHTALSRSIPMTFSRTNSI